MRILVAIAPRSYREALALSLQRHRPNAEVRIATPAVLDREVERFEPHVVVCNDGVTEKVRKSVPSWVEIMFHDSLNANVSVDARTSTVEDIATDDLLAVVDETEELVLRR